VIIESMLEGFTSLTVWPVPAYIFLGCLAGLIAGAVPGISGSVALALLVPLTLAMEPIQAVALLASALGGTTFGGAITAILMNTPGTPDNAATCLDGYPMSQQGKAGEAIGVAAVCSAVGALIGVAIFALLVPVMREVVAAFGPPELFMLALFGLTIIASLSRGAMIAGLVAGLFGLLLSYVGQTGVSLDARYAFGDLYFLSGIQLVPALIGFFAVAEMMRLAVVNRRIAGGGRIEPGGAWRGAKIGFSHPWITLRSSLIGFGIGAVPGVGGTVASYVAYSVTQQSVKDSSRFGKGDPRGLVATASAGDAVDGGTLMPTLALGIPGNPSSAVLLGALILHGTFPGRQLFGEDLDVVFAILGALVASNILTSIIGVAASRPLTRFTTVDVRILVPLILAVTVFGAYAIRNSFGDIFLALAFGVIGYLMLRFNYSRVPAIIGLVLGGLAESSFHTALQIGGGSPAIFFTRPVSLAVFLATVGAVGVVVINNIRQSGEPPGKELSPDRETTRPRP
jgi:putative tricarboxylic transport membrane protein